MKKTYYYTYKVQCTAVGWEDYYYYGKHVTTNLNDGYKGSGKKLHEYYKQYPNDFTFTIIEFYSNKTDLNIAEQKLVGDLWKSDPYCLNCTGGGSGGWYAAQKASLLVITGRKRPEFAEKIKGENNPMYGKSAMKGKHHSEETKRKMSESKSGKNNPMYGKPGTMLGKQHPSKGQPLSEEHKRKLSEARKGRHRVYREDGTYYMSK